MGWWHLQELVSQVSRCWRVSLTQQGSSSLDGIGTLPDHGADWARVHVLDETSEEWLRREVLVVLLKVCLSWSAELEGGELVTLLLESGDDLTDESTLDTVWLDSNESLFSCHFYLSCMMCFVVQGDQDDVYRCQPRETESDNFRQLLRGALLTDAN